jgi:hypothetical protein
MEQAEQTEPNRGRRKWPWLLAVVALVGIGWAGAAWYASQDEFAFLNDLHPRREEVELSGYDDLISYLLIFPSDTARQVLPRLISEMVKRNWSPRKVALFGSLVVFQA